MSPTIYRPMLNLHLSIIAFELRQKDCRKRIMAYQVIYIYIYIYIYANVVNKK